MGLDEKFMQCALVEAERSFMRGLLPVGAVVVENCTIVATGGKMGYGHPHVDHAEFNILNTLLEDLNAKDLRHRTVYTTLEPCMMCFGLMLNLRVSRVVYALEDPYGGALYSFAPDTFPPRHKRDFPALTDGVLREESRMLIRKYFKNNASEFWKDKANPFVVLCLSDD